MPKSPGASSGICSSRNSSCSRDVNVVDVMHDSQSAAPIGAEILPVFSGSPEEGGTRLFELGDLADLDFDVEVPLGSLIVDVRELLRLRVGTTLRLERQTGEHLEVTVNGTPLALGEVRVNGEKFAVRITQILRGISLDETEGEEPDAHEDSAGR